MNIYKLMRIHGKKFSVVRYSAKQRQAKRDIARDHCNLFLLTALICIKDEVVTKKPKESFSIFATHHRPVDRELVRNFVVDLE